MNFFKRNWTDGEKWGMGIIAALIIAGILASFTQIFSSTKSSDISSNSDGSNVHDLKQDEQTTTTPSSEKKNSTNITKEVPNTIPSAKKIYTKSELKALVYRAISSVLKVDVLDLESDMTVMRGDKVDSLHWVEMIIAVEEVTGCTITDEVAFTIRTVSDLVEVTVDSCNSHSQQ